MMTQCEPAIDVRNACVWIPPQNKKLKEMVALLEERLRRAPGDFWAWDNLANLCFSEGFVLQSIGIYKKALEIRPDLAVTHLRLGIAYYRLARLDVLVVDDWAMAPLAEAERRDFLEICEDRYQRRSMILTSQLPVAKWHEQIGDPTLADSILDRLVHNAHRIEMRGESMRKKRGGKE